MHARFARPQNTPPFRASPCHRPVAHARRFIVHLHGKGLLPASIKQFKYYAPEITEYKVDGIFEFNPAPFVTRETLVPLLDKMGLTEGDILIELATRIDTHTIWKEVRAAAQRDAAALMLGAVTLVFVACCMQAASFTPTD